MNFVTSAPKLAQLIADKIRLQIVRGQLAPGDNLPFESELVTTYGVSRPTVREALRILETEQLIALQRGGRSGAIVQAPSLGASAHMFGTLLQYEGVTVADVWRARSEICCSAVAQLCRQTPRADLTQLKIRAQKLTALVDTDEDFRQAGFDIADELVRLAGNRTAYIMVRLLRHIVEAEMRAVRRSSDPVKLRRGRATHSVAALRTLEMIEAGHRDAEKRWREDQRQVATVLIESVGHLAIVDILALEAGLPMTREV